MHFCVSDQVSEWLSQIVSDKVHLRWEIEEPFRLALLKGFRGCPQQWLQSGNSASVIYFAL